MIRLIVETPLADNQICTGILDTFYHLGKFLLLVFAQLVVLIHTRDVQVVLGLWAWGFKGACQDGEACVFDRMRHLGMRHVFVDEHALDQSGVGEGAPNLPIHLDQVKRHIASLEICYRQYRVDGYLSELLVLFRDTLRTVNLMSQ